MTDILSKQIKENLTDLTTRNSLASHDAKTDVASKTGQEIINTQPSTSSAKDAYQAIL